MTVRSIEAGFVSANRRLVDFLAAVFELSELEPLEFPNGTVHKLAGSGGTLKVMVPRSTPGAPAPVDPFFAVAGLRYLTIRVDDLDGVLARAVELGGSVPVAPRDLQPGVRIAILNDPDGNVIEVVQEG